MPDEETYSADEIERWARDAGLDLTPEWRDELVKGSRFVRLAKARLGAPLELGDEPGHVFRPDLPRPR